MHKISGLWGAFAAASMTLSCANGPITLGPSRGACATVVSLVGGSAGVVGANQGEGETDEKLAGAAIGLLTGAVIGYLVCGEGGAVSPLWNASIEASPATGEAPLSVVLRAQVSPEPTGIAKYEWDLGDGSTASGARVTHTYRAASPYDVRLVVTDSKGRTDTATARIDATELAPVAAAPAVRQQRIVLRGINFAFDSAKISDADAVILDVAVEQLNTQRDVRVQIVGHTDSVGPDAYNQRLSETRAGAVLGYLAEHGVARDRLSSEGRGESAPVAENRTDDGRAQNRRVEMNILD